MYLHCKMELEIDILNDLRSLLTATLCLPVCLLN